MPFTRSLLFAILLASAQPALAALRLDGVGWSQSQFNPTIGGRVAVTFSLNERARVSVRVVDSSGGIIRSLVATTLLDAGKHDIPWDGLDDAGHLVPDGAYQPVVEAARRRDRVVHSITPAGITSVVPVRYYDRRSGLIAYDLPVASVVRVVATARNDDAAEERFVAAAGPRPEGAVIEPWDGRGSDGTTYLPGMAGFSIVIETRPLPPDSVIVYGASRSSDEQPARGGQ